MEYYLFWYLSKKSTFKSIVGCLCSCHDGPFPSKIRISVLNDESLLRHQASLMYFSKIMEAEWNTYLKILCFKQYLVCKTKRLIYSLTLVGIKWFVFWGDSLRIFNSPNSFRMLWMWSLLKASWTEVNVGKFWHTSNILELPKYELTDQFYHQWTVQKLS